MAHNSHRTPLVDGAIINQHRPTFSFIFCSNASHAPGPFSFCPSCPSFLLFCADSQRELVDQRCRCHKHKNKNRPVVDSCSSSQWTRHTDPRENGNKGTQKSVEFERKMRRSCSKCIFLREKRERERRRLLIQRQQAHITPCSSPPLPPSPIHWLDHTRADLDVWECSKRYGHARLTRSSTYIMMVFCFG